jgi:hypothetical protein
MEEKSVLIKVGSRWADKTTGEQIVVHRLLPNPWDHIEFRGMYPKGRDRYPRLRQCERIKFLEKFELKENG